MTSSDRPCYYGTGSTGRTKLTLTAKENTYMYTTLLQSKFLYWIQLNSQSWVSPEILKCTLSLTSAIWSTVVSGRFKSKLRVTCFWKQSSLTPSSRLYPSKIEQQLSLFLTTVDPPRSEPSGRSLWRHLNRWKQKLDCAIVCYICHIYYVTKSGLKILGNFSELNLGLDLRRGSTVLLEEAFRQ